jgi:hypothetical protein
VERRREPRIRAYDTVQITVLGQSGYTAVANVIQLSPHGMRLVLDRPISVNAAVKVTGEDWIALGDVCYCEWERSHFAVGLHLDQALTGLKELARLQEPEQLSA